MDGSGAPRLPAEKEPEILYTGKKKKRRLPRLRIALFAAAAIAILCGIAAEFSLRPKIASLARAEVLRRLSLFTAETVAEFSDEMRYEELVKMEFDASGRLVAARCDLARINDLAARVTRRVQERLDAAETFSVRVPFGSLFGVLTSGKGLPVRVRIAPLGAVTGETKSRVESAGVNQSRHAVFLSLSFHVLAVLPGRDEEIRETLEIPFCENLYLGEVPGILAAR